jgi:N-acetylglutamate synthase-like GNAT family acetyltransferase
MIRLASSADIPRIVELGSKSLVGGPYEKLIADNKEQTYKLALQIIHGGGKILVWEDDVETEDELHGKHLVKKITGLLGMLIVAHPFSGEITADELMWYVEPEARKSGAGIKLLWEAERVAKEMDAKKMQVSAPNEKIGALYKRYGYEQIEVKYLKELR